MTGQDCPGCGLQRSFMALIEGDIAGSIMYYPGLFPILLGIVLITIFYFTKRDFFVRSAKGMFILGGIVILLNFGLKMGGIIPCPV